MQILIIKPIFAKTDRLIWAFCSHIDLCIVHLHFLHGMNLQFSTVALHKHFFMFYMRICAYFGVRFMSIGAEFILGTKQTLKRNVIINTYLMIPCIQYQLVYENLPFRVICNSSCNFSKVL